MTASTHLAVGAVTGIMAQKLLVYGEGNQEKLFWSFVAGFVSHIVLDSFIHQEYGFGGVKLGLILFVEITAMLILLLSSSKPLMMNGIIFFGMVGGALPDILDLVYRYLVDWPWLKSLESKIHFCHGTISAGFIVSLELQFLIAFLAVIFVKFKPVY